MDSKKVRIEALPLNRKYIMMSTPIDQDSVRILEKFSAEGELKTVVSELFDMSMS
jgi:hypothetical protein